MFVIILGARVRRLDSDVVYGGGVSSDAAVV